MGVKEGKLDFEFSEANPPVLAKPGDGEGDGSAEREPETVE